MKRRVVVTGMGVVSCLGNSIVEVSNSLQEQRSATSFVPQFAERGMRSHVAGVPIDPGSQEIARKHRRFMGDPASFAYFAMRAAIADAGLDEDLLRHPQTGLIAGSGVGSPFNHHAAMETARLLGPRRVSPFTVLQVMGSTVSANLSTAFGITGTSYTISSACATSAHCIGHALELIRSGKQDRVFAGGGEELAWTTALPFDAMGALSTKFNASPTRASRPYDRQRDGFVIAGGAGILLLEAFDAAASRAAPMYAELAGYAATSDGCDMLVPARDGAVRAMRMALADAGAWPDYVNTHATSTPGGDMVEVAAMREVFGNAMPSFSSTKGYGGHSIGATGVHDAIHCIVMLTGKFIAGCGNLDEPDPGLAGLPIVTTSEPRTISVALSNSFGFGGSNACLVFKRI